MGRRMFKKKKEELTLLGHLKELRKRILIVLAVNIIVTFIIFNKVDLFLNVFLNINPGMKLVYISPSELLMVYIQISFIMAIILCSPVTIYEIWAFVHKGLYRKEKIYLIVSLFFGVLCFVIGVLFCYYTVLPLTLKFFMGLEMGSVESMVSIQAYVSFILMLLLAFGIVFEMPIVVFVLTKLRVMKPAYLKNNQKIIIVAIFIFSAFITPPDVVSQILLAIPMVILLQVSIVISVLVDKSNKKVDI